MAVGIPILLYNHIHERNKSNRIHCEKMGGTIIEGIYCYKGSEIIFDYTKLKKVKNR